MAHFTNATSPLVSKFDIFVLSATLKPGTSSKLEICTIKAYLKGERAQYSLNSKFVQKLSPGNVKACLEKRGESTAEIDQIDFSLSGSKRGTFDVAATASSIQRWSSEGLVVVQAVVSTSTSSSVKICSMPTCRICDNEFSTQAGSIFGSHFLGWCAGAVVIMATALLHVLTKCHQTITVDTLSFIYRNLFGIF